MTARFAGSRFLDERRRRRLAAENGDMDPQPSVSLSLPSSPTKSTSAASAPGPQEVVGGLPLRKLISPRLWKHGVVSLLWLYIGCGIIWCGQQLEFGHLAWGSNWDHLLNLTSGSASRWYGALTLLFAGQLALLIGWVRSQSPRDFGGKYKVWTWTALVWFLFSLCLATQLHWALSGLVFQMWDFPVWHREVVGWLLPGYVMTLQLLWVLHRDMLNYRPSLVLLGVACLFAFLSGLTSLGLIETGSTMGAPLFAVGFQWSVLVSMMLHARYVVYECCDPPRLRVRATSHRRWGRWLGSRRRPAQEPVEHPRSQEVVEVSSTSEPNVTESLPASESVAEPDAPHEKPSRAKRKKRESQRPSVKSKTAQPGTRDAVGVAVDGPKNPKPTHRKSTVSDSATEPLCAASAEAQPVHEEVRIDRAVPPDELKGLTKRQRRAVRKQRREAQREQNSR
jgi:hypothetical protein